MVQTKYKPFFDRAHKAIQEFYSKNPNLDYVPSSEHIANTQFDQKNVDQEPARRISQVHRIRKGGFKQESESMYFYEEWTGHDNRGNEIQKFVVNGKYDKPIGQYQYNELNHENVCTGIARFDTQYEYPFDPKTLDEAVDKGEIDGNTTYYVQTVGGREYSGFDYDDFKTLSFEDLIYVGKTGMRPEQKLLEAKTKDKRPPIGLKE